MATLGRGLALLLVVLSSGCASDGSDDLTSTSSAASGSSAVSASSSNPGAESVNDAFPSIIAAEATLEDAGTWRFDVTVSSPYDTPERYADAWRVVGPDGSEYGIRVLTHDHASEQPFTRSQGGIEIPGDVTIVTIEGRDLANGWGGATLDLQLG